MAHRGVPISKTNPKYLHSNSTSHTWPFGAIAELIDNAYDPDVNATQIWINKIMIEEHVGLLFMDDGKGIDYEEMHKMLSFGYSDKEEINGIEPVGMYGNGFKSGSMRLGKDAIVFSKSEKAYTIGMLSQSYLQVTNAEQVFVPIVSFQRERHDSELTVDQLSVSEQQEASLRDILQYSPFKTRYSLLEQFKLIQRPETPEATTTTEATWTTGTRILIWNLRGRWTEARTELDFTDGFDLRLPPDEEVEKDIVGTYRRSQRLTSKSPEIDYSLRAYCRILYLKPRMKIFIGGKKVQTQLITKSLAHTVRHTYSPKSLGTTIQIILGYNPGNKDHYGIMMYHKNRLIKSYERVGCQLKANTEGVGVIGIIECNSLSPTHNKQDFDDTDLYRKTIKNLGIKVSEYCMETHCLNKEQDEIWMQCDDMGCLKWRQLPKTTRVGSLPDNWTCNMNHGPDHRNCTDEEQQLEFKDPQATKKRQRQKKKEPEQKMGADDEDSLEAFSSALDSPADSAGVSTPYSLRSSAHSQSTPSSSKGRGMDTPPNSHGPLSSPSTLRTKRMLPFSKQKKAKFQRVNYGADDDDDDDDDDNNDDDDDEDNDDDEDYENNLASSKAPRLLQMPWEEHYTSVRVAHRDTKSLPPPPPERPSQHPSIRVQTNITTDVCNEDEMLGTTADGDPGKGMTEKENEDEVSQSQGGSKGDPDVDDQPRVDSPFNEDDEDANHCTDGETSVPAHQFIPDFKSRSFQMIQGFRPLAATERDPIQESVLAGANRPGAADGKQRQDYKSLYEQEREKAERLMQEIDRLRSEIQDLKWQLEQQDKMRRVKS